jgi:hypothetical protein
MGITKVGPADKDDFPRKKGLLHRVYRFFYVMSGLAWVSRMLWFLPIGSTGRAIHEVTKDDDEEFHYQRPAGIPEADLTDEEREAAVARIKQEESIRRARRE